MFPHLFISFFEYFCTDFDAKNNEHEQDNEKTQAKKGQEGHDGHYQSRETREPGGGTGSVRPGIPLGPKHPSVKENLHPENETQREVLHCRARRVLNGLKNWQKTFMTLKMIKDSTL